MANLAISLLGQFEVTLDGQALTGFDTDKTRALLAYIAVEAERDHRRAQLASLLWPEVPETVARHSLSQSLWVLRRVLNNKKATPPFLLASGQRLCFNPASAASLDVTKFQAGVEVCERVAPEQLSASEAQTLTQALECYRGIFLSTSWQINSQAFEEWLLLKQSQLHLLAVEALDYLVRYHTHHSEFKQACACARRQIALEPWREAAHRQLMDALARDNRRTEALAQYTVCQTLLAQELGVEPATETTALYEQIRAAQMPIALPALFLQRKKPVGKLQNSPSSFVGRARELTRLDQSLALALAGQGQVVFITGEAGSGKSALIKAFAQRALTEHEDVLVVNGSGNAYTGPGDPYWPFIEMLWQLCAQDLSASLLPNLQAQHLAPAHPLIQATLTEHGPDLIRFITERKPGLEQERIRMFEQIVRTLQAVTAHYPLVLLLDDIQWADQASLNLLFHLGRRISEQRILLIGALRPDILHQNYTSTNYLHAPDTGKPHPLAILVNELQRTLGDIRLDLAQAAGQDFVSALLDSEPNHLGSEFRETLYHHTGGHALFTIELLHGMRERGDLVRDARGYWVTGEHLSWATCPARVEGVIAVLIKQLLPDWQAILTVACVEGDEFTVSVVAAVLDLAETEVNRRLSGALARHHHLVEPVGVRLVAGHSLARYRFRHLLFQKYLYDRLDPVECAQLHLAVGCTLETLYAECAPEISLPLARHFELGGDVHKAAMYLLHASRRATQLAASEDAVRLLTHGLALLKQLTKTPARDQLEVDLQLEMGTALLSTRWAGAERAQASERAYALCRRTGNTDQVARSLVMLAYNYMARSQLEKITASGEQLYAMAQSTQDTRLTFFAHSIQGLACHCRGNFLPARQHLEQAVSLYDAYTPTQVMLLRADMEEVGNLIWLGESLWVLGYADQAVDRNQQAVALALNLEHAISLKLALRIGVLLVHQFRREPQALRATLQQLEELSDKTNASMFRFWSTLFRGWLVAVNSHDPNGLTQIQQAIRQWETTGAQVGRNLYYMLLAEAYLVLGHAEAASATLEQIMDAITATGARFFEAEILRLQGEALYALMQPDEAVACFQQAIIVAQGQAAKTWELRAVMGLYRLCQAEGRTTEFESARRKLTELYAWFSEGLDTPDLQDAAMLMGQKTLPGKAIS